MKITKAVIPVAGKGTRFLPATKEIPKEMIPIVHIPMIHYAVSEAVAAGIEQIIFVNAYGKNSLENYFDRNKELEAFLRERGKAEMAESMRALGDWVEIISVRQKEPLGLGHSIGRAEKLVGTDTFVVILSDDIILGEKPVTTQLMEISRAQKGKSVVGVMEVAPLKTDQYGVVQGPFLKGNQRTLRIEKMVEKPHPKEAPSTLASPGRYLFSPVIFDSLKKISKGVGGEYQIVDAINHLAKEDQVYAHVLEGERFDTGSLEGYLEASLDFALRDSQTRGAMEEIIREKIKKYKIHIGNS